MASWTPVVVLSSLTAALSLGCGTDPPAGATDTASSTDAQTDASIGPSTEPPTTPTEGGNSDSDSTTIPGGTDGESQTDTGTTPTNPLTTTDPATQTDPATETDGPIDTSIGETSTTDGPDSDTTTGDDTTTTGDDTTTTTGDDTTTTDGDDTSTGEPIQCGLALKATIRDFKFSHPDMEDYCCGQVDGLVQPMLGPGNRPVFANAGNPKMLTDAATFEQWYTDVADINQSIQIVLDLQEIMPGVYSYENNNFFPVDNMLWGNEGQGHNFHFTTQIRTNFQYNGGETFTFTGDDDVWVFINKQLVIDLGGVHGVAGDSVDLDGLGLTPGSVYTLDVFHAERHTVQSNFRIDTTICSVPQ